MARVPYLIYQFPVLELFIDFFFFRRLNFTIALTITGIMECQSSVSNQVHRFIFTFSFFHRMQCMPKIFYDEYLLKLKSDIIYSFVGVLWNRCRGHNSIQDFGISHINHVDDCVFLSCFPSFCCPKYSSNNCFQTMDCSKDSDLDSIDSLDLHTEMKKSMKFHLNMTPIGFVPVFTFTGSYSKYRFLNGNCVYGYVRFLHSQHNCDVFAHELTDPHGLPQP